MTNGRVCARSLSKRSSSSRRNSAPYLQKVCGDNASLRQPIENLIASSEKAGNFLRTQSPTRKHPPDPQDLPFTPSEKAGTVVGRYKLLEPLGEGGFGEVWATEQREPVKHRVALKIIKLGMDTKQVVARFEAIRLRGAG